MVRDRRVGAGRDDRLERRAVGAVIAHQRLEVAGDVPLGASGPQAPVVYQAVEGGVGGLAGQPQHRHLTGVLDLAQRLHHAPGPHQLGRGRRLAQRGAQRVVAVDGDHMALETEPAHAPGAGEPGQVRSAGPFDHQIQVGRLLRGLRAVAPVGGQHRRRSRRPEPAERRWTR